MKRALVLVLCALFVGCGGGGSAPPLTSGPKSANLAKVTVKIVVPSSAAAKSAELKRAFTQAASTKGILFTVYAHGTTSPAIVQNAQDISPTSSLCSTSGTGRSCSVSFEAPVGTTNDLNIETVDQAPVNGAIPNGTHILAAQTMPNLTVSDQTTNFVTISLDPVVSYFTFDPTPSTLHSLEATTFSVPVLAFDADDDLIVTGNYVDPFGNPTSLTLQSQCSCITLSPATITGSGSIVTGTYDGTADVAANTTQSETIDEAGSFGGSFSLTIAGPTVIVHPLADATQPTTAAAYYGVAYASTGSGPQVFVVDTNTPALTYGGVEPYTVSSGSVGAPMTGTAGSVLQGPIVVLPGVSNLITGGSSLIYDATYSPSVGSFSQASCTPPAVCGGMTSNFGSDGNTNLWWTAGSDLISYNASTGVASIVTSSLPATESITGLAYDSSTGNVWMSDAGSSNKVYTWINSSGTLGASVAQSVAPFDMVMWNGTPYLTFNGLVPAIGKAQLTGTTPVVTQIPTQLGHPRYLYADSSTPGGLWASEGSASGTMYLMHYDGTNVSESGLGVINGAVGPVTGAPDGSRIFAVHYTTSGGELLEVLP